MNDELLQKCTQMAQQAKTVQSLIWKFNQAIEKKNSEISVREAILALDYYLHGLEVFRDSLELEAKSRGLL